MNMKATIRTALLLILSALSTTSALAVTEGYGTCLVRDFCIGPICPIGPPPPPTSPSELNQTTTGENYVQRAVVDTNMLETALSECTDAVFTDLLGLFCDLRDGEGAARFEVVVYQPAGGQKPLAGPVCADSDCAIHDCSEINTPQEELANNLADIEALPLSEGDKQALATKLEAAIAALNRENVQAACGSTKAALNQLNAFISEGIVTEDPAAALRQSLVQVRADLGCRN